MSASKFHMDNDVIITTKDEITVEQMFNHLRGRLNDFRDKSQFIVICGYHTSKTGEIGAIDHDLLYDYQCLLQRFHDHKRYPREAKIAQDKQFRMGSIIPVNTIRDWSQKPKEVYSLAENTKEQIKITFEDVLAKKVPIVLIVASCYSYNSEIFYTLQSLGIFAAINLLEEQGDITCGKFFELDFGQQELIKLIATQLGIKDIIISGKYKLSTTSSTESACAQSHI